MKVNAPTKLVWFLSIVLAVLGIVFYIINPEGVLFGDSHLWLVVAGWVLMFLGTILKGF
jgi:hypothetical protein